MRSDINLLDRDFQNAMIAKARARELLALVECAKLTTDADLSIANPEADATGTSVPASENNPIENIAKIIVDFNVEKSSNLTHMIWNPIDFVNLLSNYFVMQTALTMSDYPGYGPVTMPKMPMVTGIVSPLCPRGWVYALDKGACVVGEGPYVTEVERDAGIFSDRGYVHDFVQFLIPNRDRYGLKIQLELPSGESRGTEYTLESARKAAGPKATLETETVSDGQFE